MQRRNFLTAGAAAAAAVSSTYSALADETTQTSTKPFNLKYGPHVGMFKKSAGDDIVDQIKFAADHGFTAWEHNTAQRDSPDEQKRIGKALADASMTMGVFVATSIEDQFAKVTFAAGDKNEAEKVLASMRESVEIAKRIGAKWMTVVPGLVDPKLAYDYQTANVIDLLRRCAEILEPHDMVMVLEPLNHRTNHPGVYLERTDQAYLVCRAVDSPACKILYDIYHQQITEGNLIPNIDLAWDEIAYFQAGDNPGRKEPTTGEINYLNVFKHIHSKGFDGVVGMEHGISGKGVEGEQRLIEAYREVDAF